MIPELTQLIWFKSGFNTQIIKSLIKTVTVLNRTLNQSFDDKTDSKGNLIVRNQVSLSKDKRKGSTGEQQKEPAVAALRKDTTTTEGVNDELAEALRRHLINVAGLSNP